MIYKYSQILGVGLKMAVDSKIRCSVVKFAVLGIATLGVCLFVMYGFGLNTERSQRKVVRPTRGPTPGPSGKPAKAPEKQAVKLEYPRLYEATPCSTSKNYSVPALVCKNLAATMDEMKYRQTYLRLLDYFDKMATKHKWTYFMTFGTLLGSWRHHDVIPWDQDMDLMVEYKDRIDIVDKIDAQERFVPRQCTHHKIRLHDRDHITGTIYAEDVGRWYTPSIDMFFFVRNATHIRRSDYPTWYVSKIDEIFPLHRRPLGPIMLQAPRDVLKMLVTHYKATDVCGLHGNPKCNSFEKYVPFVHRKWKNEKMEETLMLDSKVLQVKEIDEMKENLPLNTYTLATKRFPQA